MKSTCRYMYIQVIHHTLYLHTCVPLLYTIAYMYSTCTFVLYISKLSKEWLMGSSHWLVKNSESDQHKKKLMDNSFNHTNTTCVQVRTCTCTLTALCNLSLISVNAYKCLGGGVGPHPLCDGYLGELLHVWEALSNVHEHGEAVILLIGGVYSDDFTQLYRLLLEGLHIKRVHISNIHNVHMYIMELGGSLKTSLKENNFYRCLTRHLQG